MGTSSKDAVRRELSVFLRDLSKRKALAEGPMFKQSQKFGNTFYKRYFVLYEGYLLYYPHEKNYAKDTSLQHCTVVKLHSLHLSRPSSPPSGVKHCFVLHTPHKDNTRKEMLLATSHRKAKNIWMELLQEQNPRLLPPVVENASSKPAYIQRMRLEKAMRGDGRSTATLPVSGRPRQVTRVMSLPTTSADLPGHSVRVLQRDSSTEDDSEGVSPSLSPASVARHASLPAPDLKVPVRPPRPPGREAARPISPSLGLKALSLSSSSSDSS